MSFSNIGYGLLLALWIFSLAGFVLNVAFGNTTEIQFYWFIFFVITTGVIFYTCWTEPDTEPDK